MGLAHCPSVVPPHVKVGEDLGHKVRVALVVRSGARGARAGQVDGHRAQARLAEEVVFRFKYFALKKKPDESNRAWGWG